MFNNKFQFFEEFNLNYKQLVTSKINKHFPSMYEFFERDYWFGIDIGKSE